MSSTNLCRSSGGYSSSGGGGYASDRGGGYASCSSDGEGLTSEAKSLKRRKFEQRRKQHYNMKEALQKSAFLLPIAGCFAAHCSYPSYPEAMEVFRVVKVGSDPCCAQGEAAC